MQVFYTVKEIQSFLGEKKNVGFVPTMGALHQAHISLIEISKAQNEITVCSILLTRNNLIKRKI